MRYIRLTTVLLLAACGDGGTTPTAPPTPVATSIILSATSLSFSSVGVTQQLTATVRDQNAANMSGASVTWSTSAAAVATASSSGLVTAVGDGTATITATSGLATETATVTVTQVAASIELSDTVLTFSTLGHTTQLTATAKDQNAANMSGASMTWSTSAAAVATVSESGLVTAVAAGLATITATTGTVFASAQVTVLPLSVTHGSLPAGFTSTPYTHTLEASGGNGSYEWLMISGALPLGLTLSTGGTISGTPTVTGESTFSFEVRSGDGQAATAQRSIIVKVPLQITTTSLPGVFVNSSYDESLAAFGGVSPYTWSVITGSLPNGLSLSPANGEITGTATTVGSSTFTLQVRSTDGQTASKEFTISVYGPLTITTASMPRAITGTAYSESLGASGGDGNYTWSIRAGQLPSGLSLSVDGTISGTPTSAGSKNFYLKVTSGDGQSELGSVLTIDVSDLLAITSTSPLPSGTVGSSYSNRVNATGGLVTYSWSVSSGNLPAGLYLMGYALDYDRIRGTPETAGTSTFTMRVTAKGQIAEKEFTITINP